MTMSERLLTIEELCHKLGGIKPYTVRSWVSKRKIPFTKVGRLTRFPEARINDWIDTNTVAPDDFSEPRQRAILTK
jgi:excisionase family DNA binding protein